MTHRSLPPPMRFYHGPLSAAKNLEELDLSFNCFGAKGGEAIGASLHVNTSLKVPVNIIIKTRFEMR